MRAITIKASWTVPILLGIKTVENRRQSTRYRGALGIWTPGPQVAAALSMARAA